MTETGTSNNWPQLRAGPMIAGGILAGAGVMLVMAGIAVGSSHVFGATRRWVQQMDVPPSEVVKHHWGRAKAAAAAGGTAWRNGRVAGEPAIH